MSLIFKEEAYQIIGCCMEVHKTLGKGFNEIVYKDALEYELRNRNIDFQREKEYTISYKTVILPHNYFADFVISDKIIIEVKAIECLNSSHKRQCINYLAASKIKLALLVNFGENSLKYERVVL